MCDSLHCLKCGRKDHSTGNHNAVIDEEQDAREKEKSTISMSGERSRTLHALVGFLLTQKGKSDEKENST